MQIGLPELVHDALSLRADRIDLAALELIRAGHDPLVALRLALTVVVSQRRELASITDELEDLQADHVRLAWKTKLWLATQPDLDPEAAADLEDILDNF